MKFRLFAIGCGAAISLPGAVFSADCSATANVVIARTLTANWRMLKVDVSSQSCAQSACNGSVLIDIAERLPKSSDVNSYQLSLPYEIMKGSSVTSFRSTRRFGSDVADKPVLNLTVERVSCFNR